MAIFAIDYYSPDQTFVGLERDITHYRIFEPISPKLYYISCCICATSSNAEESLELITVYELHVFVSDYSVLDSNFTGVYNKICTLNDVYVCVCLFLKTYRFLSYI